MQDRNSLGFSILVLKKNSTKEIQTSKNFIAAYYNTWYRSYDIYLHVYFKIKGIVRNFSIFGQISYFE